MKKLISYILCISLLLAISVNSFAYLKSDAMNILVSLKVIQGDPNGDLREDDLVKRSEFAKMAVLLSKYKNEVSLNSKISVFIDCTSDHWAAPYVKIAAQNGIIEGYSNGYFGPDDYITCAQAYTIALRLLGYTDEDFGYTYPEGQLSMAQSLKLNDGISKTRDELLTRNDVAIIFKNMLLTSKKGTSTNYIQSIDYDLKEDTIIIATNDEDPAVTPGKVYTSNGEYKIDQSFNKELVGKKGSAITNSEGLLITLIENGGRAQKYAVYTSGSELVSVYGQNGLVTLDCDDGTLSYKGIEKTSFSSLRSNLATGDVLTIGKDKYGNIDYIISGPSDFDGPYTVKSDYTIPVEGDFTKYLVVKNGSSSSLSGIKKDDIIYISPSLSTLFVYSKKVSGIYSKAIPNIDSPKSVVVGGKEYTIETPIAFSKLSSSKHTNIGDTVVLLLGRNGGVADVLDNGTGVLDNTKIDVKAHDNITKPSYALLSALEAIDTNSIELTDPLAPADRGLFAKMAVMSSSLRNSVPLSSKLSIFADCPSTYSYTPYIKTAVENKFMSAYPDSLFYPHKAITYAEALDASLRILGYTDTDFSQWPSSQLSIAQKKGITKGVSKTAYDEITICEAIQILYNTLCSTNKTGSINGIELAGYSYYDDAVIIATNSENTSVPSGKVLTSVGTFSIDDMSFDNSLIGKSGELLIHSGKLQMFNMHNGYYSENVIYSPVPGGLNLATYEGSTSISVSDSTPVYIDGTKTSFSKASSLIAVGDTAYMFYDSLSRLKYIYIGTSSLKGPFVIASPSSWYKTISGASNESTIMKNGYEITSKELCINDILYFSPSLNTAFVYNDKVIGILESATPSKEAPDTVKVSGTSYKLETADVSFINSDLGDTVVLCLGRNGKIAHSYSASLENLGGFLTDTGIKSFAGSNGDSYTSNYARLTLADGTQIDCATDYDYNSWINKVMSVTFDGGKARLSVISSPGTVSGVVDAQKLKIGSHKLSSDVKILDVGYIEEDTKPCHKSVYLQRIDGLTLSKSDILYAKTENGIITEIILNNVTGDALSYGIITLANSNINGFNASGSYSCDIKGTTYSYSGGVYTNLSKGSVVSTVISDGRLTSFKKLNVNSANVKEITYTYALLSNGTKLTLSDDVAVYKRTGNYDYTHLPLSEVVENSSSYSNISVYTDKSEDRGGRVRVILVR